MSFLAALLLCINSAWALDYANHIYNSQGQKTDLSHLTSSVQSGDIVIVGEKHGFYPHHEMQTQVIAELQNLGFRVHVGMEHIPYLKQKELDDYISGKINQDDFLKELKWRKSKYSSCLEYTENNGFNDPFEPLPFDCYTPSLKLAFSKGGASRAINLPRSLTGKVSSQGIDSLSVQEKALLPPNYQWGSPSYYERFREVILSFGDSHGPISEEMINNMFWSQSLWDESMSWKSLEFMQDHTNDVMVILVGDFHGAHGDGLAARFKARGAKAVHIISQSFTDSATQQEIDKMAMPDPKYGPAGDLVVITKIK